MRESAERRSTFSSWPAAVFVAFVFFLVWTMAILRLHKHFDGEFFLHWNGIVDSLIALLAPLAIAVRFWQTKAAHKISKT